MPYGSLTLMWLLMGVPNAAPIGQTEIGHIQIGQVKYAPEVQPLASATLLFDGRSHTVSILNETNVSLRIVPAEYQDLDIAKSFDIICDLPLNQRPLTVSARIDTRYHLIPLDIIDYKDYAPSYIKLGIDTIYIRNSVQGPGPGLHKVYLEFFASDQGVR